MLDVDINIDYLPERLKVLQLELIALKSRSDTISAWSKDPGAKSAIQMINKIVSVFIEYFEGSELIDDE